MTDRQSGELFAARLELLIGQAGALRADLLSELHRFLEAYADDSDRARVGRAGETRLALSTAAEFAGRCVEALTALRAGRAKPAPAATSARTAYGEGVEKG